MVKSAMPEVLLPDRAEKRRINKIEKLNLIWVGIRYCLKMVRIANKKRSFVRDRVLVFESVNIKTI